MKFYSIYLPIQTALPDITYSSKQDIVRGARVIVSFNRRVMTGICNKEINQEQLPDSIKLKEVIEVLDSESILPLNLLKLAEWISMYYRCAIGKAVFAMLPSVIIPEIATELKWIGQIDFPPEFVFLRNLLSEDRFYPISEIKQAYGSKPFYKTLESAETNGLVEIKRAFDAKVKPKTVNYVRIKQPAEAPDLTTKQLSAWQLLCLKGDEFPLKTVADDISYSIIKALVSKGLIDIVPKQLESRAVIFPEPGISKEISLTSEQSGIIQSIISQCHSKLDLESSPTLPGRHPLEPPNVHLLYGITGSGKTEVYIGVIRFYLEQGHNIILLIPEIALTPQMVDRFFSAFGSSIAILHSQLTERQRFEQWQEIKKDTCRIVIGARSAIFAPLNKVGLIIVDEEHEQSYKQENIPRYHGRDVAIVRARIEQAAVILGSATPSLETWYNVETGKYQKHILSYRPTPQGLPQVQILDLRDEEAAELISVTLRDAIQSCLDKQEQVILLQNRRGFASFIQCRNCGILQKCPNCDISLYYHHDRDEILCHYCGYHLPIPRKCPACGSYTFAFGAPGTQKIEQLLKTYFPLAKILRMDSDSSRKKDTYNYMYNKMRNREIDILLGTQMISKGLDFPFVTLVGVILADISLNVPDFRAAERTFNLLTQVAGRSGRGEQPGKVIIQTWNPEHYAIRYACDQDFVNFALEEMQYRKRLYYPPYYRIGRLLFTSTDEKKLKAVFNKYHNAVENLKLRYQVPNLLILGPSPAPMSKMNKLYRYHLILKAIDAETLSRAVSELESLFKLPSAISLAIDIDPISLM